MRSAAVALNDGNTTHEEFGVSSVVQDYRGEVAGCITASAPRSRVQHVGSEDTLRAAVLDAAEHVSARLGFHGVADG